MEFLEGEVKVMPRIESRHNSEGVDGVIAEFACVKQVNEIFYPEPVHQVSVVHVVFYIEVIAKLLAGDIQFFAQIFGRSIFLEVIDFCKKDIVEFVF